MRTPKAWLCKHCGERVDPTMALCWNCGHDRDGERRQDLLPDIEQELMIHPDRASSLTRAMQNRGVLLRLFLVAWCVTGLFVMITGAEPIRNRYSVSRGPADEFVIVAFYLSLLITFMLIAHRLVYKEGSASFDGSTLSYDLHKPWIRRWMIHGWGSVLFWFAWAWLLLSYAP